MAVGVEAVALAVAEVEGPSFREGLPLGEFQRFPVALQNRFLLGIQPFALVVDR